MSQMETIQRLDAEGKSRSKIAVEVGVSRPTVRKYGADKTKAHRWAL